MQRRHITPLPAAFQVQILQKMLPTIRCHTNRDSIQWTGQIEPLPICDTYTIKVDYTTGGYPQVRVLSPELVVAPGRKVIPHMFDQEILCLFRGRNRHWHPGDGFNRNIIPWTSMWLYYYEIWLATGEWHGGGEHPDPRSEQRHRAQFSNTITGG